MSTIVTQLEGLTPVSDGSTATYSFVDDLIEERGNGQHRELRWNLPESSGPHDTTETREVTEFGFTLFLHRTPTGQSERTQYVWIQAINNERAQIHRTINGISTWGDSDILEVIYRGCETEDVTPARGNQSGGVHRPLVAALTFNLSAFTQEND